MSVYKNFGLAVVSLAAVLAVAGCASEKPAARNDTGSTSTSTTSHDDHSGWWCNEHGIPEEECSMCSAGAVKDFKAKGDWCEEHNRAESQCFICDPNRAEKYAKLYEAKYGKKPPAISD